MIGAFAIRLVSLRLLVAAFAGFLALAPAAQSREYSSIVVDAENGTVLHASNPDAAVYPASLTKIMTLYLLFDALESGRLSLETQLPVSKHASVQKPSKLGLKPGETISVENVVLALVTKSANDAAVVAAEGVAGTEENFARLMTRRARSLGMHDTIFQNASGLPDPAQVSSARDMALLGRALVRDHGRHYHYFSTREFRWRGQPISTHNRLMLRYDGADGIKTGYIHASGFNLVASAKRDGKRIVGVVFGGDTAGWRDRHMAGLLDKGFARLRGETIREASLAPGDIEDLIRSIETAQAVESARTDAPEDVGDADPSGWAIQVGAFRGEKPARGAAAQAAKKLGGLVSRASIEIDRAREGGKPLYRARLAGFTEDQARAACRKLKKAKKDCALVEPRA